MVAIPQVGVAQTDADTVVADRFAARVVGSDEGGERRFVFDFHRSVEHVWILFRDGKRQVDLFCRVLVGELHVFRKQACVRRLPLAQGRQGVTDVGFAEMLVAADVDRGDSGFEYLEAEVPAGELLLRGEHLNRGVAGAAIGALHGFQRHLDVAESLARAQERLCQGGDLFAVEQRVAVHVDPMQLEQSLFFRHGTRRDAQGCGREEKCEK